MNDDELIAARNAKTHPFGSDCSAKCLEDSLADRLEVLSTPEPDYKAALVTARDAWSRIDRLGNRPEDRVALDRAFDVLAATPEPELSDDLEEWVAQAIWDWGWEEGDDAEPGNGTRKVAQNIIARVRAVAPVEVTRDELAKVIDATNIRYDGYGGTWTETLADAILAFGRVSRRDGEDKK